MSTIASSGLAADLDAHRQSTLGSFPEIVDATIEIAGRQVTAYVASVRDMRTLDRWRDGRTPLRDIERRMRLTYHILAMLAATDCPAAARAWLLALNPELEDEAPIEILRSGDLDTDGKLVLKAARLGIAPACYAIR